jgi:outer membrane protein
MPFVMSKMRRLPHATVLSALLAFVLPAVAGAEPISANQAVDEALRHNPTLRAAVAELNGAQALTQSESARYDSTLLLAAGATRTKNPSLSPGSSGVSVSTSDTFETSATLQKTLATGTQLSASLGASASRSASPYVFSSAQGDATPVVLRTGPGYLLSARLGVTQPLLRGAGSEVTLAPYRQAAAQQTVAERENGRTASALARDVLSAYWELWYAEKAVAVDHAAEQTASAQRDDAARRAQTGSLAFADVLTFETQLATIQEQLLSSEVERTSRRNELGRLLGRERGLDQLELSESEPPTAKDLPSELLTVAVTTSPDVATSQASLAVARLQERTAANSYRPRLDLDAYLQSQGLGNHDVPSAFSQLAGLGVVSAHVGLTFELPLTTTRYRSETRRARATVEAAEQRLEAARHQVVADLTTLVRKRELSRRRIELATGGLTFARQNLAAKRALFATGSATALEIIQAQDSVQAADKRLARARVDVAAADLAIAYHLDASFKDAVASR